MKRVGLHVARTGEESLGDTRLGRPHQRDAALRRKQAVSAGAPTGDRAQLPAEPVVDCLVAPQRLLLPPCVHP